MRHNASRALYFPLLLLWTPFIAVLLLNTPQYRDKKRYIKKDTCGSRCVMSVSSPFFPPPPPLPLSTPLVAVVYNLINLSTKNINIEVKKKKKGNIPGARDALCLEPQLNVIKKNPLLRGGSQPVVVVVVVAAVWLSSSSSSWIKEVGCYGDRYTCL